MTCKNTPVLILGGGAWGLSTALHMLNSGYANITIIERGERIPSRYSAAWDLNKIVRAEYEDAFYTELALVSPLVYYFNKAAPRSAFPPKIMSIRQMQVSS